MNERNKQVNTTGKVDVIINPRHIVYIEEFYGINDEVRGGKTGETARIGVHFVNGDIMEFMLSEEDADELLGLLGLDRSEIVRNHNFPHTSGGLDQVKQARRNLATDEAALLLETLFPAAPSYVLPRM
jgi:hypothetical protein